MKLDFLSKVTVSAAPVQKPVRDTTKKVRQPESGLTIRLFKDGSVYPSNELIAQFKLEYQPRDPDKKPVGFGLDVIDSRDMTNQINTPVAFVGVSLNPRYEGKLDLFSMCKYDETTGLPVGSVADQGSNSFGKAELIPLLEQVYGDDFAFNDQGFVDLQIIIDQPIVSPDGRFFFYKKIVRGADAGKKTYVIRDNTSVFALVPVAPQISGGQPDAASIPSGDTNSSEDVAAVKGSGKGVQA